MTNTPSSIEEKLREIVEARTLHALYTGNADFGLCTNAFYHKLKELKMAQIKQPSFKIRGEVVANIGGINEVLKMVITGIMPKIIINGIEYKPTKGGNVALKEGKETK